MRYQEVKAREAARLAAMAAVSGLSLVLCVTFRAAIEPIVNDIWPTRRDDGYATLVLFCALFSFIFAAVSIGNLATSPAQDARLLNWAQARKSAKTSRVDKTMLEPDHPDWKVPTFRYLMRRLSGKPR